MALINYFVGEKFLLGSDEVIIRRTESIDEVTVEFVHSNEFKKVSISELTPSSTKIRKEEIQLLNDDTFFKAKNRYDLIKPIIENPTNYTIVEAISKENNIHPSTLYRWVQKFKAGGTVSGLANKKRDLSNSKSRIGDELELIIKDKIDTVYLNLDNKSFHRLMTDIEMECYKRGIKPPAYNTVKRRLDAREEYEIVSKREGKKKADNDLKSKTGKLRSEMPYDLIQIDHTPMDIILVDEVNRMPFQKPYLTLAIDIYSRMVVGYYLSFDSPSTVAAGQCIANAILPKEKLLSKYNIDSTWPCWGVMRTIHLDNAKEFRGRTLKKACTDYAINIYFRPVKVPRYGGHIERLLGTFSKEIHDLPGTTFSNPIMRKNYDSQKMAAMTITELEKWLLIFITKVYHERNHTGIETAPIAKYKSAFTYEDSEVPAVPRSRYTDERRIKIDFLPFQNRTIQRTGVKINNIEYFDEVLTRYISQKDSNRNKKFLFRIDPRDISKVYFYSEQFGEYFEVPYSNLSYPAMTISEYRFVVGKLKEKGVKINQAKIFEGLNELREIEEKAIRERKRLKRVSSSRADVRKTNLIDGKEKVIISSVDEEDDYDNLEPFDEIELI
jgi:putative transposase